MNFFLALAERPRFLFRHELEKLREEHRKTEESRLEKEEEMWRLHEKHKGEMEVQKQTLAIQREDHERERALRELELDKERQTFLEEKQRGNLPLVSSRL